MRRLIFAFVLTGLMINATAGAHDRPFPYEAVVESDSVEVRSGPGMRYYATGTVNRGCRLTVHKHDPGGWWMISPPPGSFSWIRSEYIRKTGPGRGTLTANDVVVRVGSELDETRGVVQRRLSTGDRVEILGEQTFQTERGEVHMYKIKPPKNEFRYLPGRSAVPLDQMTRDKIAHKPDGGGRFQHRSQVSQRRGSSAPLTQTGARTASKKQPTRKRVAKRPQRQSKTDDSAVQRRGPTSEELDADRRRLKSLDRTFRGIVDRETGEWDFDRLEQDYRQLQQDVSHPALASQINLRFAALRRYQKIKKEFDDFVRLTSATNEREAYLLSLQQTQLKQDVKQDADSQAGSERLASGTKNGPSLTPLPIPNPPQPDRAKLAAPQPAPAQNPPAVTGQPGPPLLNRNRRTPAAGRIVPQPRGVPRRPALRRRVPFDGAGIIQRSAAVAPGGPRHVLIAPNGRILAYLQGERSLNLDQFLGRSMGVSGPRYQHRALRNEVIIVRRLAPVRLLP